MVSRTAPTFALLIGIDDYSLLDRSRGTPRGTADIRGTRNDLSSMAMLIRMMDVPAAQIRVLSSPQMGPNDFATVAMGREPAQDMNMSRAAFGYADKDSILKGVRWLAKKLQRHPGAQGIIYYSGHSVLTRSGHPAFCPLDTVAGPAPADAPDTRPMAYTHGYIGRALQLSALDDLLGNGNPRLVKRFIDHLKASPVSAHPDPGAWLQSAAQAVGRPIDGDEMERFVRAYSNTNAGYGGVDRGEVMKNLGGLTSGDLSADDIQRILHGDPFAEDADLRNLISFNKLLYQQLRDVPEEQQVHVIIETCLDTPGRAQNEWYATCGLPLAHGNIALFASCRMDQSSYRGVFDNRWHGAFTWAMVSILSQKDVRIAQQGRSFAISYDQMRQDTETLMHMLGFNRQNPGLWASSKPRTWEVFGTEPGQWTDIQLLAPHRVREEISAGETDSFHEIVDINDPSMHLGWFLALKDPTGPWQAGKEYWIWNSSPPFPLSGFRFRRPPAGSGGDLNQWLQQNGVNALFNQAKKTNSGSFQGAPSSNNAPPQYFRVYSSADPGYVLANVVHNAGAGSLTWYLKQGELDGSSRMLLPCMQPGEPVLQQNRYVCFAPSSDPIQSSKQPVIDILSAV